MNSFLIILILIIAFGIVVVITLFGDGGFERVRSYFRYKKPDTGDFDIFKYLNIGSEKDKMVDPLNTEAKITKSEISQISDTSVRIEINVEFKEKDPGD